MRHFIVTRRRVLLTSGVIVRTVTLLPLRRITDLTWQETLLGQVLGYGTFRFESAGQDQALRHLTYMPDAQTLYRRGQPAAVRQRLRRRGVPGTTRATRSRRHRHPRRRRRRPARHRAHPGPPAAEPNEPPRRVRRRRWGRLTGDADRPAHPLLGLRRHRDARPSCWRRRGPRAWTSSRSPTTTRPPAGRPPRRRGRRGLTVVPGMELSCRWFPRDQPPISVHLLAYLFDPAAPGLRRRAGPAARRAARPGRADRRGAGRRRLPGRLGARSSPAARAGWWAGRTSPGRWSTPASSPRSTTPSPRCCTTAARTTWPRPTPTSARASRWSARPAACRCSPTGSPPSGAGSWATTRSRPWRRPGCSAWRSTTPTTPPDQRAHLRGLADDLGLIVTGSSDYHGTNKQTPIAACTTDPDQFEALLAAGTGSAPYRD